MIRTRRIPAALAAALLVAQAGAGAAQGPRQKAATGPRGAVPSGKGGAPPVPPAPNGKAKDDQAKDGNGKDDKSPAAPPAEPPPPYEPKLLRLGEILGTLAYLRGLCGDADATEWRRRMSALIDAEGSTKERREQLAGAFNRGFRGYQFTYHACTAAAQTIIERLLDEGDRITRDVTSRYAG